MECEILKITADYIALIGNEPIMELPDDLFIPPEALTVLLEQFSGPLDLLLYLIRKQNIDILDIPVVPITRQYMQYIALMRSKNLDLTAEYLVMAATLAEIKSRMLLPVPAVSEEEEIDPRMDLVRQIQVYEQMKFAAMNLDALPRCERDVFPIALAIPKGSSEMKFPDVELQDLPKLMLELEKKLGNTRQHEILRETFSVRERMQTILERIQDRTLSFIALINRQEGRGGLVTCFLAVLELGKLSLIHIRQSEPFQDVLLEKTEA